MAHEILEDKFEEKVLKADKTVLVDFYASWCGPCQALAPIIDELAQDMKDAAYIYKVDVEKSPMLASQYQVMSIPTLIIFKNGKPFKTLMGFMQKEVLAKELEDAGK